MLSIMNPISPVTSPYFTWNRSKPIGYVYLYTYGGSEISYYQGPDLYAFIGFIEFIRPDDDDLNWLLILIFDY